MAGGHTRSINSGILDPNMTFMILITMSAERGP